MTSRHRNWKCCDWEINGFNVHTTSQVTLDIGWWRNQPKNKFALNSKLNNLHTCSSVSVVAKLRKNVVGFLRGKVCFLPETSRVALGPTLLSIQQMLAALTIGIKRPRREADQSYYLVPTLVITEHIPKFLSVLSWHNQVQFYILWYR
jgi:hypothetical protein